MYYSNSETIEVASRDKRDAARLGWPNEDGRDVSENLIAGFVHKKRESIIDGRGFRVLPAIETVLGGSKSRDRRTAGTMGGIERTAHKAALAFGCYLTA